MSSRRITIRVNADMHRRIEKAAEHMGVNESEVIRRTLQSHLPRTGDKPSVYDVLKKMGAVGCAKKLPNDLSTNRKHMEGFGTN